MAMEGEPIHSKIRELTRAIEKNQDLLSDPQKRSEYKEYVLKDDEFFENIGESDYRTFSLLCEFGSVKALVNEKRYNKIYKQSQNSLLRNILKNWKDKYMNKKPQQNDTSEEDSDFPTENDDEFVKLNWNGWFNDHFTINVFPINNIKFNTLQGLLSQETHSEPPAKRVRVVNNRTKNTISKETKTLEDEDVHDTQNIQILQEFKNKLLNKIQEKDINNEGIELWELVLEKDQQYGFANTCFNLFSLLSLLKDSLISITSPNTVIKNNTSKDKKVLVFLANSSISSDFEKNTGIISNFTYHAWQNLCKRYGN
ncbi:hypothetical protein [Cryptosporidium parvum Iowa II]|uniref:Uncharacterized protein n=2 Tax=Cryptosporidium parvum TaxID=5807 RepID=Q5CRE9_CRYPI|nr:hypothetical protein [Cryptosporidium parvum Iowa II]EAK88011.1 hypothetical protein cgd5_3060 [Cryptosporidium parvum Iowa II]QOY41738.1 Uncharacterized protein CPATCC_0024870 [Cryptosporidium parvum]WKS77961.1 hypothetical protein CPCDC_5g3060 [Cryptosporidium sp. 43IA8]WRK32451.1 Uncharacterized protein cpbgf_5003060 [Cryptosporidium parvum]|eukprot:QOY41738.1 hypothetical protein CPATCC_002331 [Cryptosporidium parvum]